MGKQDENAVPNPSIAPADYGGAASHVVAPLCGIHVGVSGVGVGLALSWLIFDAAIKGTASCPRTSPSVIDVLAAFSGRESATGPSVEFRQVVRRKKWNRRHRQNDVSAARRVLSLAVAATSRHSSLITRHCFIHVSRRPPDRLSPPGARGCSKQASPRLSEPMTPPRM
jgi:hypothetical protein